MTKSACTFDHIAETQELQELSVVNYMAAKGYEPVYGPRGLQSFFQPKFACIGKARVSFNSAVRQHNKEADAVYRGFTAISGVSYEDFICNPKNEAAMIALFAGTAKIVRKAKLVYSRKEGVKVQSHKIEFVTPRDARHYGKFLEA